MALNIHVTHAHSSEHSHHTHPSSNTHHAPTHRKRHVFSSHPRTHTPWNAHITCEPLMLAPIAHSRRPSKSICCPHTLEPSHENTHTCETDTMTCWHALEHSRHTGSCIFTSRSVQVVCVLLSDLLPALPLLSSAVRARACQCVEWGGAEP